MPPKTQMFNTLRKLPPRIPKQEEGPPRFTQTTSGQVLTGTLLGAVSAFSFHYGGDILREWNLALRKKLHEFKEFDATSCMEEKC